MSIIRGIMLVVQGTQDPVKSFEMRCSKVAPEHWTCFLLGYFAKNSSEDSHAFGTVEAGKSPETAAKTLARNLRGKILVDGHDPTREVFRIPNTPEVIIKPVFL